MADDDDNRSLVVALVAQYLDLGLETNGTPEAALRRSPVAPEVVVSCKTLSPDHVYLPRDPSTA
jgi:hypothetical protein